MAGDYHPNPILSDVIHVRPVRHGDDRGWFTESWSDHDWRKAGMTTRFVQDNHSYSALAGTVRGLHYQAPPFAQAKLVRCLRGAVLDIVVDIRRGAPTFGQHIAVTLSARDGDQLFVPEGFAHGFCTLEPDTEIAYKVSAQYASSADRGIAFDDPDLGIEWPLNGAEATLSAKDRSWPRLADAPHDFMFLEEART